jgi:hypothetical protein
VERADRVERLISLGCEAVLNRPSRSQQNIEYASRRGCDSSHTECGTRAGGRSDNPPCDRCHMIYAQKECSGPNGSNRVDPWVL